MRVYIYFLGKDLWFCYIMSTTHSLLVKHISVVLKLFFFFFFTLDPLSSLRTSLGLFIRKKKSNQQNLGNPKIFLKKSSQSVFWSSAPSVPINPRLRITGLFYGLYGTLVTKWNNLSKFSQKINPLQTSWAKGVSKEQGQCRNMGHPQPVAASGQKSFGFI